MPLTKEERDKLRASLGIDKPLYVQYITWVWGAVRFDFGDSLFLRRTNTSLILERLPRSMEIAVLAVIIGVAYGVTLGVISAVKQDTWIDYAARVLAIGGIAMPSFFVAVMAFFFLILWFNWIPPIEYHTLAENPLENLKQVAAPALVLGLGAGASISRLTRSQML
jgi:peptide/nickel transport system permease protein